MVVSTTFSGAQLDRAAERRGDEGWLAARLEDPTTRAVAVTPEGVLIADRPEPAPAYLELPVLRGAGGGKPLFLGLAQRGAIFAVALGDATAQVPPPGTRAASLREAGTWLGRADAALLAYAQALVAWHRRNPFCPVCGTLTDIRAAGHVRACPNCGALHHPRTDPVVITLVTDGNRALLGRQPAWPAERYSALAGFVEPGESLEEAVAREIREEACVEVEAVLYRASQPWPFPASLMLGFVANYAGGTAAVGDGELEDVRWFDRGELREAGDDRGPLKLPPPVAIARRLIDAWLDEPDH